jgi:hypothetical protein
MATEVKDEDVIRGAHQHELLQVLLDVGTGGRGVGVARVGVHKCPDIGLLEAVVLGEHLIDRLDIVDAAAQCALSACTATVVFRRARIARLFGVHSHARREEQVSGTARRRPFLLVMGSLLLHCLHLQQPAQRILTKSKDCQKQDRAGYVHAGMTCMQEIVHAGMRQIHKQSAGGPAIPSRLFLHECRSDTGAAGHGFQNYRNESVRAAR